MLTGPLTTCNWLYELLVRVLADKLTSGIESRIDNVAVQN